MKKYLVVKYTGSNAIFRINEIDIIDFDFSDDLKELRNNYNLEVITNEFSFMIERDGFSQYYIDGFGYYLINTKILNAIMIFNNHFYNCVKDLITIVKRDYKLKNLLNE
jgi:hypothetical protein